MGSNKSMEPFPILENLEFNEKDIKIKRSKEKIVFAHMINIYCKKEKHIRTKISNEDLMFDEDIKDNFTNKSIKLCDECFNIFKYAVKRTEKCPHIAYKTFCNRCPSPCYKADYREKIVPIMLNTRKELMFKHPIITFKHLKSTISGIKLAKKMKRLKKQNEKI